jgi:hypothetical protein
MAIEKTINLNVDSKGAVKGINDLEKSIDGVNKEVKETNKSTQAMSGTLDKATGGAVSKFTAFKGAVGSLTTGFKSLRVAIIGTGIGALLIAITALGQAFTRSEEGQNKFAKILGVIGSVTGNLLDLLADLGENIISVFENPKKAITDFANLIKDNIVTRFEGLINLIPNLGRAVEQLFKGNFKEAGKIAADSVGKVVLGVDSVTDSVDSAINSVKEFGKEIKSDAEAAAKIADQRATAEKKARDLIVERAEAERKIAELREKAVNKDKFTAQERIKFLEEAGRVSDELAAKEVQVAKLRLEAKQTENALTKSNKDDLNEAAQLEASVIQLETQRLNLQKRLSTELLTSRREVTAEEKADLKELSDLKKTLRDAEAVSEQEKRELELIKIQEHYDNLIAKANENNIKTDELEAARDEAKLLKQAEFDEKDLAAKTKKQEAEQALRQKTINELLAEKEAKAQIQLATIGVAEKGIAIGKQLAGKNKDVQKALLIAENAAGIAKILINTGVANAKAVATSPITGGQPWVTINSISAGLGIAGSIAATAKGLSALGGGSAGSKPNVASGGGGGTAPAPPSFNVVGASETSVLADTVAEQTNEPVQAYVVSNDVTTAQSLENNIVEGATI